MAALAAAPPAMAQTITLSLDPSSVAEDAGATTVTVTATLSAARTSATPMFVNSTAGGTALGSGTDYLFFNAVFLTIPANGTSATETFTFTPVDDSVAEGPETVILSAVTTLQAGFRATDTATLTIIDDDAPPIKLSLAPSDVAENAVATTVTVTAALEETRSTATEVTVSRTGGTATSGTDYAAVNAFTVTIPAEQTSVSGTFTFTPTDDSLAEGDETLVLSGSATGLTPGMATLTITDDDMASTALELSVSPSQVWESAGATTITATVALNGAARTTETRVTLLTPYGDSEGGIAYPLTIPANDTSATRTFTFTPEDDSDPEPPEARVLTAFASTATGLANGTATLTIIDDDAASAITLSVSPEWVAEDAGATTVTVTAGLDAGTRPRATEVTVSRTGGTATSGTDFAAVDAFTVTIPAEQTSGTATFTLTPTDDSAADGAETVILSGSATGLTTGTATLTITDDDSVPTNILLSVSQESVAETAGATTVTVTAALDAGTRTTATNVLVGLGSGTATSGTDYAAVQDFTVTIPAEQTSATGTFTFTPTDDSLREAPETVIVASAVVGVADLSDWSDTATLTITDDDAAALVILSVSPGGVWEHLGAETVTVTAALLEAARATATEVTVSRTGGTAISGTDYAAVQDFTVTIPAEQTSGTATFTFTPTNNSAQERTKTVILGEKNVRGRTLNTVPAVLGILDYQSTRRAIELQVSPRRVEEHWGATTATVTGTLMTEVQSSFGNYLRTRSRPFDTEVTVSRAGGTATSGTDYAEVEDFTLTIPAGEESATATFTFTPTEDDAEEGDETVILSASGSGEALVLSSDLAQAARSATLTITDDDTYVPANWALVPSGLTTGDRFRLLFVTAAGLAPSPTDDPISNYPNLALSVNYPGISLHNEFVQSEASADSAHVAIRGFSQHFRVVGSERRIVGPIHARDNTWTTYTDDHKGVPIYWLGGSQVADHYEDFYDGDWDDEANPTDSSGQVISAGKVWTGSHSDGTVRYDRGPPGNYRSFGNSPHVGYGVLNDANAGGPISAGIDLHFKTDKGYYALSRVLRVGTTAVAPTAIVLSASPASVAEDGGATTVTVTATLDSGTTRTTATEVTVSRTGGTATSGTDYAAVENFTVTIPADHLSGTATFTLTPTDDDVVESADETVILSGSAAGLTGGTVTLTITDDDKLKPVFPDSARERSVAENTVGNVGAPVTATNPNNDPMSYTLGGTDVSFFSFVTESGQILTSSALDHEVVDTYEVTVTAQTPNGLSATVPVTITVTDVDEPPKTPAPPTVRGLAADSVQVSWTAPENTGPAISDYDVRYQADGSESWIELGHEGTGLSITVTGLAAGTYAAQVRATNPEGTSGWSPSGTGTTKVSATEVPSDWSLAPSGLVAGDAFRLLFVSSGTRDATSTDIGDYNTFVQNAAAAGHTDIQDYSAGFHAVASTADVDARANTDTVYADDDKGPPIYWLGGAQLADDYEDFYGGKWDEEETGRDEAGDSVTYGSYDFSDNKIWTGSGQDGTESAALGTDRPETGLLNFPFITIYGPLFGAQEAKGSLYPLYGLSEVFQIVAVATMNSAPTFANNTEARSVAENTGSGENVGAVVTATDANSDTLEYSLEGTDAASFEIDSASGQIRTQSALDHETKSSYSVTVKADDNNGGSATVPVTITVTDVAEQPATPTAPSVTATAGSTTSLDVSWTAPGLNGGPALTGYEVQYRKGSSGSWIAHSHSGTGTSTMIASLDASSEYEVQVRALNGETPSGWSPHGSGTTGTPNSAPTFANNTEARSVAENSAAETNVGAVVTATDTNNDTLEYSLEGTDASSFEIDSASGQIQTQSALDHETKSSYSVTVKADDNNGGSATVPVTITVTDVAEQPATPTAPSVTATAGSTTSLDVSWTAPGLNGGPALTGYEVEYRKVPATVWTAWTGTVTGTSATITPLDASSEYEVQVRALNGETPSGWSPHGSGTTGTPNAAPTFANNTEARSVAENTGSGENVGAVVTATDANSDTLEYSLEGTDASSFEIDSASGQIQTQSALDHETKSSYSVTVKADDNNGGSATVPVTITVTDVAEQPATPTAPSVTATAGSTTSLDVSWTAPGTNGGPALTGYEVEYRKVPATVWTAWTGTVTGTSATITPLDASSEYEVQVRALNGETPSGWSPHGSGTTGTPNAAPTFANNTEARSVAENTGSGENVGAVVTATDANSDTLEYSLEGTDAASFEIDSTSGQIQTKTGVTYDHETKSSYSVTVKADDNNGGSATVPVTITVTDVAEQPATPTAPSVTATAGSTTSLDVSWTAPGTNGGPALTGYEVEYRKVPATVWTAWTGTVTGTSTMIASLDASSEYEVQVRALNGETPSGWSPHGSGTTGTPNSAPTFANNTEARSVAENTGSGENVGAVVTATDANSDTLEYSLEGTDASSFEIDSASGQIQTQSALDHETKSSYSVTVKADDNNGGSATVPVTITVTDVAEQPATPTAPSVTATAGSTTSLDVSWTAPGLNGGPALTGYEVEYRKVPATVWTAWTGTVTGTSTTITPLDASSEYEVQVRALNGETPSGWSPAGSGTTGTPNSAPTFANNTEARSVAENSAAETNVGAVVTATDANSDTLEYSLEGTDASSFEIDSASGQIQTKTGVTYDHETKSSYSVTVKADDNNGGSATVPVTITVTDVAEQPATPTAPSVTATAGSTTSLDVSWTAPGTNGGPALTGYEVQYRKGSSGSWIAHSHSGTGTSATITPLDASSEYEVQVRALNGETPSGWSPHGSGTTGTPNAAPTFANNTEARSVAENTGSGENVGAVVTATDANSDTLEYSLEGTDASSFEIDSASGQIRTQSALDHETKSSYSVTVKADDNNGGSATVPVTITVTDVAEQPATPTAPSVTATAGSTTSLDVSWTAPGLNGGPALTGYEVEYRKVPATVWTAWTGTVTGTSATITPLDASSEYQVQVRALNGETPSGWSPHGSGTTGTPNSAPTFANNTEARSLAENTGSGENVGAVVTATDANSDTLEYSLEGTDASSFEIDSASGQIQTQSALDHETKSSYSVTVKADDNNGGSATVPVTITVTDVAEQPATPTAPSVTATAGSTTSLDVSWTAPGTNGGPALTGYEVEYRKVPATVWTAWTGTVTGASATITPLDASSEYQVQVRALNGETPSAWSPHGSGTTGTPNSAPVFANNMEARSVAENTGSGENVGAVVTATDTNNDTLEYSLEGTDAASFEIDSASGQIQTKTGVTYDHEAKGSYSVTVKADDNNGGSATVPVTITVTDVAEQPSRPTAPSVTATSGSTTSLDVGWTEPGLNGGPALTGYEVEYRKGSSGSWSAHSHSGTGTSTMIAPLDASSEYQVQVRALNGETPSAWSPHGSGTTGTPNSAPVFANNMEARSVAENTGSGENVGAVVTATDTNNDTLEYSLEGTDAASFEIDSASGQIQTKTGVTYDHEAKGSYSVTVKADDNNGGSATVPVTITVTDVAEQPSRPTAPSVTATSGSTTSLDVGWTEPGLNGGPALTGYEVEYRKVPATVWTAWTGTVTGASATITPLDASSEYQVQVRALNGETPSAWSPHGSGTTGTPNSAPVFANNMEARSVAENTGSGENVGAVVTATDTNNDTLEYSLEGTDAASFEIDSASGQIQTKTGVTYDHEAKGSYSVTVKADDNNGGSATVPVTITVTDVAEQPSRPTAPSVTATSGSTTSLDVGWTEPGLNGGPALTGYEVQYRKGSSGSWSAHSHSGMGTSTMIASLDASSDYQVQVQALNGETPSDWSPHGTGTTGTPNRALTVGMASGTDPPVSGSFTVRFSFSELVTGFNASDIAADQDPECRDDQGDLVLCDRGIGVLETTDNRVFTTTVTPETDRVAHNYTLMLTVPADAVRSSVDNKPNEEATLEVRVAPPGVEEPISSIGLQASPGSGSVRLAWNEPTDPGGSAIIRYEYRYQEVGEAWSEWENVAAGSSGVTVGGLINGQEYVLEVRAVNALGKGGAETVQATPERRIAPPPRGGGGGGGGGGLLFPPEAPLGLMAMAGEGAVRLEWSPPESDGGTAILRYEYRLKEGLGEFGEWTPIEDSAPGEVNASGYTVGKLENGTVYVFELRAVNLVDEGPESEAVEAVMLLDRTYWSNFLAEDLEASEASLEWTPFGGTPRSLRLRFGAGLRFEESELDGEGEVSAARMGSYGYRYTSQTTGELRLDYDGGETCQLRMTFRGVGEGSYSYRCGGALQGQGSFRLTGLNRVPEITSTGPFEVVENQAMVVQLEAVDPDEGDEIAGYGIAGGADGALFAVDEETGELMFREAPDYETPGDVESAEPESGAGDNEYIVVVEVWSGEGEREQKGQRAIRVRVRDEEEPPEITSVGPFEVVENRTVVGQLEAVDQDKQDEITEYGIAGGADGELFAVVEETGKLKFREAPDFEAPGDVESAEPESGAGDNEYVVMVEARSGEGERERKGSRAIRVRVSDEEEPPEALAAPAVTPEGTDSLKVSWAEPENRGPAITDYEVRYREEGEEGYSDGGHEGTGLTVTLSGLKEETLYEVQVRAANEEGIGEWSEPGEGRTETTEPDADDPSSFTGEDLEGRRLTLRLEGEERAAGSLELRFGEDNRFEQIESGGEQAATRSEGVSRSGTYTYERTGPRMGRLGLGYDDGSSCEVLLTFTESGLGTFAFDCGDGNPAEGSFRLTTGSLFIPVILSSAGRNDSFFTSEMTLTNRGEQDVSLDYTYTAERGGGSGTASEVLHAGRQRVKSDALGYLIGLGVPIPESGNRIGTLRVEVPLGSEVEAVVRTTTVVPDGRAGLAYLGVTEEEGFTEAVYLCGLRQNSRDRSNLAFQNMGAPEEGAITLRATVYSGEAADATARVLEDITLEPGGFHQYSPVLGVLESSDGDRQGYVKVERVEGEAPFYAYGVINDQANSDGSFVFPVTASSLEGKMGQTLPVIVETSEFRSELTVTNFSEEPRTLDFQFVSEGIKTDDRTASFSMKLEAGQQEIVADVVEALRRQGETGLGSTRGFYAGPLFAVSEDGDMSGIVIGARTGSEGGGGSYSVFYTAVPEGEAFSREAWVDGLQQNEENRSNLALVNTGEVDGSESVFHLEIYDGETGMLVQTVVTRPIPARRWHQINGILGSYAPETRQGYVRIEKVSGANPFLAYGVVNDGAAPGERSGDGAYLPAQE